MVQAEMRHLYRQLYSVLGYGLLPLLIVRGIWNRDWRTGLAERLGFGRWNRLNSAEGDLRIWLHAASVGEIGGLVPVLRRLQVLYPQSKFLITTTSRTGQAEIRKQFPTIDSALLPIDLRILMRGIVRRMCPSLVVVFETEVWPNLYWELERASVPVLIVNGRISDRSFPQYKKLRWFFDSVFDIPQSICVQSPADKSRFLELGAASHRVIVSGSSKYDLVPETLNENERSERVRDLGFDARRPLVVFASVRPGEDTAVIRSLKQLHVSRPEVQSIIAPRHPEAFESIARQLTSEGIHFRRRQMPAINSTANCLLLDTLGELRSMYPLASLAFVGGTLVPIGGHNPVEPAACGIPVLVGPYVANVRDVVDSLKCAGGLREVRSAEELSRAIGEFLDSEQKRIEAGMAAQKVANSHRGATDKIVHEIERTLMPRLVEMSSHRMEAVSQ